MCWDGCALCCFLGGPHTLPATSQTQPILFLSLLCLSAVSGCRGKSSLQFVTTAHPFPSHPKTRHIPASSLCGCHLSWMSLREAKSKMTCSIQFSDATGSKKVLLRASQLPTLLGYFLLWALVSGVGFYFLARNDLWSLHGDQDEVRVVSRCPF